MRVIALSTMFESNSSIDEFLANTVSGSPSSGSEVQYSLLKGIESISNEGLRIINAIPAGTWPKHYRKIILHNYDNAIFKKSVIHTVGCLNVPIVKQICRYFATKSRLTRAIMEMARGEDACIIMYHFYLPHMIAALQIRRRNKNVSLCIIVPDLPNEYGIGQHNKSKTVNLFKRIPGIIEMNLAKEMDKFVLFTEAMKTPLGIEKKKYLVMEGICSDKYFVDYPTKHNLGEKRRILYSGNLSVECGVDELIEAFERIENEDVELHLYGSGNYLSACKEAALCDHRIVYHEPVSLEELCAAQQSAYLLINPRRNVGNAVKYFFPSKTFGYMASGRPMVGYWLDCFPEEYRGMFFEIDSSKKDGVYIAVTRLLSESQEKIDQMGEKAKLFVKAQKNAKIQAASVYRYINV